MPSSVPSQFWPSAFPALNVALATVSCATSTVLGHPEVCVPVCAMVSAVYGIGAGIEMISKRVKGPGNGD